jgi:FkbM family methyltransferase
MIELHDGSPFLIDTESLDVSTDLIRHGRWEEWIERHVISSVSRGSVFVDAGANVGYYSVVVGRVVGPAGRVYAFEPNPSLYRLLRKNFFINGLRGGAFSCALGEKRSDATLWIRAVDSGGAYLSNDPSCNGVGAGHANSFEVEISDDALAKHFQEVSMNIDLDGHEPETPIEGEPTSGKLFPYGFKIAPWARISKNSILVSPSANDAPAVFGPYVSLIPGGYEATFDIALLSDQKQASVAFDVTADSGNDLLSRQEVVIASSSDVQSIKLRFDVPGASPRVIELRVHAKRAGLVVNNIRCRRLDPDSGPTGVPIQVRTLDDILVKDIQIDCMKVDVEGQEPSVIAGAKHAIKRSPRLKIFLELNPQAWAGQGYNPKAFFEGLESMGFEFHLLLPEGVKICESTELLEFAGRLPFTTHFMAARAGQKA